MQWPLTCTHAILLASETSDCAAVSKSVVRNTFIVALFCGATVSLSASGQQKHDDGVRLYCKLLHSHAIKIVRPIYPELARQAHIEGRVSLACIIGRDGLVKKIEVKEGHPLLIQAATEAVSQWKFKPLVLNGQAVEMETAVNIDFQLPKEKKKVDSTKPRVYLGPLADPARNLPVSERKSAARAGSPRTTSRM